jgi:hypothetical protein
LESPLELYNLKADPTEEHDVAADQAEVVMKIEAIMAKEHVPSPNYDAPLVGKRVPINVDRGTIKKAQSLADALADRDI